jgi:hypothetical protein
MNVDGGEWKWKKLNEAGERSADPIRRGFDSCNVRRSILV